MKKGIKSIKREEFFKMVALNSGVDLETSKNVYWGMIRTISRELKGKKIINLPDWGKFFLSMTRSRRMHHAKKHIFFNTKHKPVVRFSPDYKIKEYFYKFGEENGL